MGVEVNKQNKEHPLPPGGYLVSAMGVPSSAAEVGEGGER